MKYTGLLEAIDLIENSGTRDSLRMAVGKIKREQEILESLQSQLATADERIKKMSKGDLGPESILSGYGVLVKSLKNRRDELRDSLTTAKDELATANTHIGWLKEDKIRLNKSIKVRDGAIDAFIDLEEKADRKLTTAKEENERLQKVCHIARCPCGGWLEGIGHRGTLVIYQCDKCTVQLEIPKSNFLKGEPHE